MKKPKWYELVSWVLLLVVLIVGLLNLVPITTTVEQSIGGVKLVGDEGEKVTVTIAGNYKNYLMNLFKEDSFEGKILVSSYPEMQQDGCAMFPITWHADGLGALPLNKGVTMGTLWYLYGDNTNDVFGTIFQKDALQEGVIFVNDAGGTIVFPASDEAQAETLLDSLISEDVYAIMKNS